MLMFSEVSYLFFPLSQYVHYTLGAESSYIEVKWNVANPKVRDKVGRTNRRQLIEFAVELSSLISQINQLI
jgi:hypothetical protein